MRTSGVQDGRSYVMTLPKLRAGGTGGTRGFISDMDHSESLLHHGNGVLAV